MKPRQRKPALRMCRGIRCNCTIKRGEVMCERCLSKLPEPIRTDLPKAWKDAVVKYLSPDRISLDLLEVARSHLEARR